jgi:hypothetical protein
MGRRKRAAIVAMATLAVLVIAVLASLAFRPALLLGIEGNALARSVDSKLPSVGDPGHCERGEDNRWLCHVLFEQDPGSGGDYVVYRVRADGLGCWHAVRPPGSQSGDRLPARMEGCIYLWDF